MCGELFDVANPTRVSVGSSPRVRGTHPANQQRASNHRFIPACAGNSRSGSGVCRRCPVHPRVCGELDAQRHGPLRRQRFIPACAGNSAAATASPSASAVHPRVCGELLQSVRLGWLANGSSPRVRGTHAASGPRSGIRRFIPACAGNSRSWRSGPWRCAVHPRVCGELSAACRGTMAVNGSSPRVRGTRRSPVPRTGLPRFIPACAGNSPAAPAAISRSSVHPRVCGELSAVAHRSRLAHGSSPRVRGTPRDRIAGGRHRRFIPACAGNSPARGGAHGIHAVHPRVCGELPAEPPAVAVYTGSSPRVRGTRRDLDPVLLQARFIPACAGNSGARASTSARRTVHPRVCGELQRTAARTSTLAGSSPRVRGTPWQVPTWALGDRFIPACAGNSGSAARWCIRTPVHPRVCGELVEQHARAPLDGGSSPRVRGTRPAPAAAP